MPSTYSTSLKLELIANGEQSGTWGATTNNNLGTLIEQAITGVGSLTLVGDTTLTNYNGLPDEARNAVLTFSGSLAAPANVIAPAVQKTYIITNNAGANVTIKTATGNGVTVGTGLSALIYCDGTDFYTAVNVNNVIGDLSVSGNITAGGSLSLGNSSISGAAGNLTFTANSSIINMATNTGAFIPPTGTTAQRPATPSVGMSRWNSDGGQYEVWNGTAWQVIASGAYNVNYLIVAGGGGGGNYGGGGAGGFLNGITAVTPTTSYTITVGSGGGAGSNGQNSSAFTLTAIGGGRGDGGNGGSGGGTPNTTGQGTGTVGQGNDGGTGPGFSAISGGGGGAGTVGGNGNASSPFNGGVGGAGLASSITGSSAYYAGGGGGNTANNANSPAAGGVGGGGNGNVEFGGPAATNGTANTGGGAGGGGATASGGSGIVIVSYQGTTQRATGGTVTSYSSGGYTYWVHTFTNSGTFVA